jgi:hypothetical protein
VGDGLGGGGLGGGGLGGGGLGGGGAVPAHAPSNHNMTTSSQRPHAQSQSDDHDSGKLLAIILGVGKV